MKLNNAAKGGTDACLTSVKYCSNRVNGGLSGWFTGVLHKLDESVGKVVQALQDAGILQDSILVFTTDNGGPAAGFNINAASNWPLRGVSYYEN
jgi:membrane-anchored protein YejM (alkaline phosphatase superfamily)